MSKKSRKVVAGEYDVVIVGGGVGGITVGVFTSRYGLSTLILDRGRSSLGRIAHLENFPGFPGGIDTPTFQKLLHAQAERVGCEITREKAVEATQTEDGFRIETETGDEYATESLVAAAKYGREWLETLDEGEFLGDDGGVDINWEEHKRYGRTSVDGLYFAGRLGTAEDQAVVAAGQAGETALGLIHDVRRDEGLPEDLATHYTDWVFVQGSVIDGDWEAHVRKEFPERVGDADLSEARFDELQSQYVERKVEQAISPSEQRKRRRDGHRHLVEHIDDDAVLERAEEIKTERSSGLDDERQ
ncbi:NAD(P)/FAD-dependent oxidoreductase [Haloarcula hispanica]|uniref:NAD(P)/FAD-dependent oxidoreductase n=1 Tax=Haloarcula hispanica TaxID=51589 RepID=A0A5J5LE23_HALHI|nr:NAD(P)/FAD-dependent oxidoreductase [Haloarcula hispanica]KAA9404817.1 NAD(P)/FAD-dependent oxidoreductase [Haloarcula hispanica]